MKDQNADVRGNVVFALGVIGGEAVIAPLIDAIADQDQDVREVAEISLEEFAQEDTRE